MITGLASFDEGGDIGRQGLYGIGGSEMQKEGQHHVWITVGCHPALQYRRSLQSRAQLSKSMLIVGRAKGQMGRVAPLCAGCDQSRDARS
jgi:hypothetical protein